MVDEEENGYWLSLLGELGSNQDQPTIQSPQGNNDNSVNAGDSAFLFLDVQSNTTSKQDNQNEDLYNTVNENDQGHYHSEFYKIYSSTIDPPLLALAEDVPPPVDQQLAREKQETERNNLQQQTEQLLPTIKRFQPYQRRPNLWLHDNYVDDDNLGKIKLSGEDKALLKLDEKPIVSELPPNLNPTASPSHVEALQYRPIVPPTRYREDIPSPVVPQRKKAAATGIPPEQPLTSKSQIQTQDTKLTTRGEEEVLVVDYKVTVPTKSKASKKKKSSTTNSSVAVMWRVSRGSETLASIQTLAANSYQQLAIHWERQLQENQYLREALGLATQTVQVVLDRSHSLASHYLSSMLSDDPEQQHLQHIKQVQVWEHVALRCSLASLSFRQRQLLAETRTDTRADLPQKPLSSLSAAERSTFEQQQLWRNYQQLADFQQLINRTRQQEQPPFPIKDQNSFRVSSSSKDNNSSLSESDRAKLALTAISAANITTNTATTSYDNLDGALTVAKKEAMKNDYDYYGNDNNGDSDDNNGNDDDEEVDEDDFQFLMARYLTAPGFAEMNHCSQCQRQFGVTLFRHHCRHCGQSFCADHSSQRRRILRFGLISPVRVCSPCANMLDELRRVDQLVWRDGRVQAWLQGKLLPVTYATLYGDRDIDRSLDKAMRVADYSLSVARNALILNFPTKVALETIDVLKRYGLTGFAGLLLTGEFMEAIETLKQLVRMDDMFPSLHELTACVYYKLAIDRGLRGCQPDLALETHRDTDLQRRMWQQFALLEDDESNNNYSSNSTINNKTSNNTTNNTNDNDSIKSGIPLYECKAATERDLSLAIRYAPLALDVVYADNELDMRRLGRYHQLELLCSNVSLQEELLDDLARKPEQPVYALFVPQTYTNNNDNGSDDSRNTHKRPECVLAIRGTSSIQDVVTDIRAAPMVFPPPISDILALLQGRPTQFNNATSNTNDNVNTNCNYSTQNGKSIDNTTNDNTTTNIHQLGEEYVCEGMARSALYVLSELGPALLRLLDNGCDLRIVGHSLGGAVAALLTLLVRRGVSVLYNTDTNGTNSNNTSYNHRNNYNSGNDSSYKTSTSMPQVRGLAYGCPSCLSTRLSDELLDPSDHLPTTTTHTNFFDNNNTNSSNYYNSNNSYNNNNLPSNISQRGFLSIVLRDDVIARVTPQSARQLLRDILVFRNQVFRHLQQDWSDVLQRTRSLWAPRVPRYSQNAPNHHHHHHNINSNNNHLSTNGSSTIAQEEEEEEDMLLLDSDEDAEDDENDNTATNNSNNASKTKKRKKQKVDLWQPGRVLHVYPWRGQWHASVVSRDFPSLRTIAVQGHIFEDHRSHNIFNALLETLHVQRLRANHLPNNSNNTSDTGNSPAKFGYSTNISAHNNNSNNNNNSSNAAVSRGVPPVWTAFDCADKCACCLLSFTWHSTFRGAAQEFRERYNCRNCGHLVCGPCSQQKKSIPRLGMLAPRRVCDRCFLRGDFSS